jgi:hypothetical protein
MLSGNIIYIAKALCFAAMSVFIVFALGMVSVSGNNSKAIGLVALLRTRGALLLLSGSFQVLVGLLLLRMEIFVDGGRLHGSFLR